MLRKFLYFWIKGSLCCIIIITLLLITGSNIDPLVDVNSSFFNWFLSYLLMLTPIGAALGFFLLWFIGICIDFMLIIFGKSDFKVTKYLTKIPASSSNDSFSKYDQADLTNKQTNLNSNVIRLYDGMLSSKFGGTILKINSQNFVSVQGIAAKRIGKIDSSGIFRTVNNETIGQFDENGILREYSISGGKGTGKAIGELQ